MGKSYYMTFTQAQAESLYNQVLDMQDDMIRRGRLSTGAAHHVSDGRLCADGVTTIIECTCGRGLIRPDAESQAAYALHIADELGLKISFGRAA